MTDMKQIVPFSLKDAPALIEKILPAQKLSVEAYKEQMAHIGKSLTALGSYWKGRKPLILNKACILGCLIPATNDLKRDLQVFEMLMAMDEESFVARIGRPPSIESILNETVGINIYDYFDVVPDASLPPFTPFRLSDYPEVSVNWKVAISELERRKIQSLIAFNSSYKDMVEKSQRPEEVIETVHSHIWDTVNEHYGTDAFSFQQLTEQLGIMRFGHRPIIADTFSGSGQITFEASRLGCDVSATDLNPIACMLTWGAFNIVGAAETKRRNLSSEQKLLVEQVQKEIDNLNIEKDGHGWSGKVYFYCVEAKCQQSGWMVPLLPTLIISKGYRVIAKLVPDNINKRYNIELESNVSDKELAHAEIGTVRSDGRGQEPYLIHHVSGVEYKTKISSLREDYTNSDGSSSNKLRLWEKTDFTPRPDDIYQERLYAVQWMRQKKSGKSYDYEFRSVTPEDLHREQIVIDFIAKHLVEWQDTGLVPDMKIEMGYNTRQPIWERGWTYWHHLFNPRQLLLGGLVNKYASNAALKFGLAQMLNVNARLSRWNNSRGGGGIVKGVFDNQALNTLFNYGCRGFQYAKPFLLQDYKTYPLKSDLNINVAMSPANEVNCLNDIYVTDPPYGDAVKYEEIFEFFIAWLRKNPPHEFANWTWDSRRALAIKGEDEGFRRGMVAAYKSMAEHMPDNGIQVIMFTHQSGSIWADMANIVWASGLHVTAAWYVVTETDSALREGSYVKGTVLLVLRKRHGNLKTSRSDLAWEIQEEVEEQVNTLTGLNQDAKDLYRDENLFSDADLQMAGYAAALRVLTRYSIIDGKEMATEAVRPRVKGQTTFVDELIEFAVGVANQALVPHGIEKSHWDKLQPAERFYLKMLDLEAKGAKTIDNYQNFAKAFKVKNFKPLMASEKANAARLKSSDEFGRAEMSGESEMANTVLRGVLYGIMELLKDVDGDEVLTHISYNIPDYHRNREVAAEISDYLASNLEGIRPPEASSARVLRDLVRNQKWG